jgi:hypothetical protein
MMILNFFIDGLLNIKVGGLEVIASKYHRVMVCRAGNCNVAFRVDQMNYHFKRHHKMEGFNVDSKKLEVENFFGQEGGFSFEGLTEPIDPVPGLEIKNGYKCPSCLSKHFVSLANYRAHMSYVHGDKNANHEDHKVRILRVIKHD